MDLGGFEYISVCCDSQLSRLLNVKSKNRVTDSAGNGQI